MHKALNMLLLTPHIKSYLESHDPMALRQATLAVARYEAAVLSFQRFQRKHPMDHTHRLGYDKLMLEILSATEGR